MGNSYVPAIPRFKIRLLTRSFKDQRPVFPMELFTEIISNVSHGSSLRSCNLAARFLRNICREIIFETTTLTRAIDTSNERSASLLLLLTSTPIIGNIVKTLVIDDRALNGHGTEDSIVFSGNDSLPFIIHRLPKLQNLQLVNFTAFNRSLVPYVLWSPLLEADKLTKLNWTINTSERGHGASHQSGVVKRDHRQKLNTLCLIKRVPNGILEDESGFDLSALETLHVLCCSNVPKHQRQLQKLLNMAGGTLRSLTIQGNAVRESFVILPWI
ncbi:hypothetical protein H0H87_010124 [Tephrocybe sp. NHM501043]|nr:hypothetical protein H0H87_010124 [Tephrocybe sp. NHM501043]